MDRFSLQQSHFLKRVIKIKEDVYEINQVVLNFCRSVFKYVNTMYTFPEIAYRLGHYTYPDVTIGERFPREKYIINLVHNMSNA